MRGRVLITPYDTLHRFRGGDVLRRIVRGIARHWIRARGKGSTRIRGTHFWTDPYHIGFWRDVERNRWEPDLLDVLDRHLGPTSVYVDVGAWIGPTVIFAARKCRRVYCLEPDPEAYQYLLWNLRLNELRNVTPFNVAIAHETGMRRLVSPAGGLGDSKSSLLPAPGAAGGALVPCMRWPDWLAFTGTDRPDLIKMDIEGGEFEVIPSMGEYLHRERPALYLSLHAPLLDAKDRERSLDTLLDLLGPFTTKLGEDGRPVTVDEIRQTAMTRFCSFLFTSAH